MSRNICCDFCKDMGDAGYWYANGKYMTLMEQKKAGLKLFVYCNKHPENPMATCFERCINFDLFTSTIIEATNDQ